MLPAHLEEALIVIEQHFNDMSAALVSDEPAALLVASTALRQAAVDFSELLQRLTPTELTGKDLKARLQKLSGDMVLRRESLIRRSVLVERALNAVVPATCNTTYSQSAGPYGKPGQQTGAFKVLSA